MPKGHNSWNIWWAQRSATDDPLTGEPALFSPPERVPGCVNSDSFQEMPSISPDRPAENSKIRFIRYVGVCDDASDDFDICEATWHCDPPTSFRRGDANAADGRMDMADAVYILMNLFADGPAISCPDAADANDDERIDISDPVYILARLFAGGDPMPAPHPDCGADMTPNPDPTKLDLGPCDYCADLCKNPPEPDNCPTSP